MSEKADPYAGMGGSYLLDPLTGVRTRVEFTKDAEPAAAVAADEGIAPVANQE